MLVDCRRGRLAVREPRDKLPNRRRPVFNELDCQAWKWTEAIGDHSCTQAWWLNAFLDAVNATQSMSCRSYNPAQCNMCEGCIATSKRHAILSC